MSDNNNNSNLNADKRQHTEELHRQGRTNFIRRRVIMKGIDDLWQDDLLEMIPYQLGIPLSPNCYCPFFEASMLCCY